MEITFDRIQQLVGSYINEGEKSVSTENIHSKEGTLFLSFMANPLLAQMQYQILTAVLAGDLFNKTATPKQIQTALVYAEVLEHVYQHLLNSPREVTTLRRDKALYRRLLFAKGYHFTSTKATQEVEFALEVMRRKEKESPNYLEVERDQKTLAAEKDIYRSILIENHVKDDEETTDSVTKTIREMTATLNNPRLFGLRLRRFLLMINILAQKLGHTVGGLEKLDRATTPIIPFIGWIFFIPRLVTNLFLMGKHVVPNSRWMDKEEQSLDWRIRLWAQLQRRWFELANDLVWFVGGLVICFALIGKLAPAGVFLGLALQAYDLVLAVVRAHVEFTKFKKLKEDYRALLQTKTAGTEEYRQIETYIVQLQAQIASDKKRIYLSLVNNMVMMIAVILMLPVLLANPWIAVAGGLLAVTNSIFCYVAMHFIEKSKPKNRLSTYSNCVTHLFFKPEPTDPSTLPDRSPDKPLDPAACLKA